MSAAPPVHPSGGDSVLSFAARIVRCFVQPPQPPHCPPTRVMSRILQGNEGSSFTFTAPHAASSSSPTPAWRSCTGRHARLWGRFAPHCPSHLHGPPLSPVHTSPQCNGAVRHTGYPRVRGVHPRGSVYQFATAFRMRSSHGRRSSGHSLTFGSVLWRDFRRICVSEPTKRHREPEA